MAELQKTLSGDALVDDAFAGVEEFLTKNPPPNPRQFFAPQIERMLQAQAPTPEAVPEPVNPFLSLAAGFGGNVASSVLRNPNIAQNVSNALTSAGEARQETQRRNYVQQVAFDKEKEAIMNDIEFKLAEKEFDAAVQAGDAKRALVMLKAQKKLAEAERQKTREEALEDFRKKQGILLGNDLEKISARGRNAIKALEARQKADNLQKSFGLLPDNAKALEAQLASVRQLYTAGIDPITAEPEDVQAALGKVLQEQQEILETMQQKDAEDRARMGIKPRGEAGAAPTNPSPTPPKEKTPIKWGRDANGNPVRL